jgi:hypothetical protein
VTSSSAPDGFRSAVRAIVAPEIQPIYSGYVIWRAVIDEADLDPETYKAVFEKFAFFLAPGHEVVVGRASVATISSGTARYRYSDSTTC